MGTCRDVRVQSQDVTSFVSYESRGRNLEYQPTGAGNRVTSVGRTGCRRHLLCPRLGYQYRYTLQLLKANRNNEFLDLE
jgi:hypothetical protein